MSEDKKLDKQKTINYTVIIFYIGAYVIYNFFLFLQNINYFLVNILVNMNKIMCL